MQGITNITKRFPNACRYMNEWISKHARKGFTWTSIAVNRDAKSLLHADPRNLRGSENFALISREVCCGLKAPMARAQRLRPRPMALLLLEDRTTLRTLLCILPHTYTIVCYLGLVPGTRFGLIAFTSSQVGSMNSETREQLDKLNFRLPIPAAVAAPARRLPRPIACTVQGGLKLKQWWTRNSHYAPAHLLPLTHLITSVRDEGGACVITSLSMAIVVMASLSVGDLKRLRRNLVEIAELAHLFSENFCVLLCGFIDEELFGGLKAVVTGHKDASLVCAGLQALQLKDRVEEQLRSQHRSSQHGTKAPDCKVADLEEMQPLVDRAVSASNSLSVACPCAADSDHAKDDDAKHYPLGGREQGTGALRRDQHIQHGSSRVGSPQSMGCSNGGGIQHQP